MEQTVQKWGNSWAVRIPKALARELGLRPGNEIEMASEEGALILRPRAKRARRKYDLDEMISRITEENMQPYISTGSPVGKEIWEYNEVGTEVELEGKYGNTTTKMGQQLGGSHPDCFR